MAGQSMSAEAISNLTYEIGRLDQLVNDLKITLRDSEPNDVYASHLGHINHSFITDLRNV